MMNTSIITGQVQSVMQTLMMKLIERLIAKIEKNGQADGLTSGTTSTSTSNATASSTVSGNFSDLINQASQKYGVSAGLIQSIIKAESNFNPNAVSSAGAQGLMQLMPGTARGLGVTDSLDPAQNIEGGTKFLRRLLDHYDGNVRLAVAAYNAGPGAVDKYGGIPPYQETQTYVNRVLGYYQSTNQWQA